MAARRVCFIISPIGPEESDIRARANQFLSLIAEPALEVFNFEVIRADMIPQPTAITADIIRLVQESDLCLIDLTDSNPNVFYECGRRHETGKPFIQLVEKGALHNIPFDVAGIRTIDYDLTSAETCRASVKSLQKFIRNISESGFQSVTSGASLTSIAQGIERVERRLNALTSSRQSPIASKNSLGIGNLSAEDYVISPLAGYRKAIASGDIDRAFMFASRASKLKDRGEYLAMISILASGGHQQALDTLESEFQELITNDEPAEDVIDQVRAISQGTFNFFRNSGQEEIGLNYLLDMKTRTEGAKWVNDKILALLCNSISMAYWNLDDFENSLNFSEMAVNFDATRPSYVYNLCISYEQRGGEGDYNRLNKWLKELSILPELDEEHKALLSRHNIPFKE